MHEETSCKATKAIIEYIRTRAEEDGEDANETVKRLLTNFSYPSKQNPYPLDFLLNIDHWVELEASDALFEQARILLRDEESTYKIAAATPQFKGLFGLTENLARVVGPEIAMRRTPRLQRALQRTSHLELQKATASQAVIKITYHEPYRHNLGRDSCDFARGILSAVPQFAGLERPATLKETHCTLPIHKRGVIDGYFYVKDGESHIWSFEWPFEAGDDQIPLPAQFTRELKDNMFEFKTRQGSPVSLTGRKIGRLEDDGSFEWDKVKYGGGCCIYQLEWQSRAWLARWADGFRSLFLSTRAEETLAERQHRIQEMADIPSSLSLAVVFDDIAKRLIVSNRMPRSKVAMVAQFDRQTNTLIVRDAAMDLWEAARSRLERIDLEVIGRYVSLNEHKQNLAVQTILSEEKLLLAETDDVFELFRPLVDHDTCQDLQRRIKHLVTVPLYHQKHLVGNLFIATARREKLTARDKETLTAFARRAATEVWNASQYERRVKELEELHKIDQAISSTLNLDQVLNGILAAALRLTSVEYGRVLLVDKQTEQLVARVGHGLPPEKIRSALKISVSDQDKPIGQIEIQSDKEDAFDEDDERLLETLAGQAVVAIKNAQQYEALIQERDRRINAEVLAAMIDLSGKMVHRMRGHLGGARSDIEEIRTEYISQIRSELQKPPAANRIADQVDGIEELLDDIYEAVENALELVDNLRKPFKIELGSVSVSESLDQALNELSRPPNLIFDISEAIAKLPRVWGSSEHLAEVFHILLTNAIEATPKGRQIRVACSPGLAETVAVTVTDTGVGMDREVMGKIFNYGFTTKSTEKKSAGGYGFGLWWVKRYLQRIKGDIYVESTPGQGSQFTLLLPVQTEVIAER